MLKLTLCLHRPSSAQWAVYVFDLSVCLCVRDRRRHSSTGLPSTSNKQPKDFCSSQQNKQYNKTLQLEHSNCIKGKGSPYSITERRVPELIPVLCSQPAGDVSHKPGGRLPLLSARPAVTSATLKRAATNFCCLVNRGTMDVNSLPKTVTRQRRDCNFNPGPTAPESSTLTTTRLPSHPCITLFKYEYIDDVIMNKGKLPRSFKTLNREHSQGLIGLVTRPQQGGEVLWWPCLFVCVFVGPRVYVRNYTSDLHQIFGACPWFRALPASLRYVLYFRFYGRRRVCT